METQNYLSLKNVKKMEERKVDQDVLAARAEAAAALSSSSSSRPSTSSSNPYARQLEEIDRRHRESLGGAVRRGRRGGLKAKDEGRRMLLQEPKTEGDTVGWDQVLEQPTGSGGGMLSRSDGAEPRKHDSSVRMVTYSYVTCNMGNLRLQPACPRPAIRFTGFFNDRESAEAHQSKCDTHESLGGQGIPTYVFESNKLCLCGIDPERVSCPDTTQRKKRLIVKSHVEWAQEREKMFNDNVERKTHGKVGLSGQRRRQVKKAQNALRRKFPVPAEETERRNAAFKETLAKAEEEAKAKGIDLSKPREPLPYPRDYENRSQQFVIVTVLPDSSTDGDTWQDAEGAGKEPMFIAQTTSHSETEVEKIAEQAVWKKYMDAETLTAPMYEWLYLDDIDNPSINNHWSNEEQNLILKRQEQDQVDAEKFAKICQDMNKRVPVIDVTDKDGVGMIQAMHAKEPDEEAKADARRAAELESRILDGTIEEARKAQEEMEANDKRVFVRADGAIGRGHKK